MEWLKAHHGAVEVIFGTISLLGLVVVVYLNYRANKMAEKAIEETNTALEQENRPYVFFQISLDEGYQVVNASVMNKGKGIAKNISISLEQPIYINKEKGETIDSLSMMKGVPFLPPQGKITSFLGFPYNFFKGNEEVDTIGGKIMYQNASGKTFESPLVISMKTLRGKRSLKKPGMTELIRLVEDFERTMQRKSLGR